MFKPSKFGSESAVSQSSVILSTGLLSFHPGFQQSRIVLVITIAKMIIAAFLLSTYSVLDTEFQVSYFINSLNPHNPMQQLQLLSPVYL